MFFSPLRTKMSVSLYMHMNAVSLTFVVFKYNFRL